MEQFTARGQISQNSNTTSYLTLFQFKSWTSGAGFADNVTWEDITLVNVSTPIFLTQKFVIVILLISMRLT